jgi:drug/metabolite transporter (DMT)-like permease
MRNIVGIVVGVAGIVILFGPQALASFGDSALGAMAAIAASFIFAGSLFVSSLVRRHHPLLVASCSLSFAALWTVPLALFHDGLPDALPGMKVAASILVLSLFNTAAASLFVFALVARAGPAFTALNNYLVPAVAVACGTIFLHEPLTVQKVAGALTVLAGVAISSINRKPAVPAVPPSA